MQEHQADRVGVNELARMLREESPPLVVDVRSSGYYAAGHIPGAVQYHAAKHVPVEHLIVAYCDLRPSRVKRQYQSDAFAIQHGKLGYEIVVLDGGLPAWKSAGLPVAEDFSWFQRRDKPLPRQARLRAARTAPLEDWFHNVGTSDDATPWAGDLDGYGWSLSAQALEAAGVTPGGVLVVDGIAFRWPRAGPGWPNNVVAAGQALQLPTQPGATRIGLLGLSTQGSCIGQGEICYEDGGREPFTLALPDFVTGERDGPVPGVRVAVRMPRWNDRKGGPTDVHTMVFAVIVPLRLDKTAVALSLPRCGDGKAEQHIFAVALDGAEH